MRAPEDGRVHDKALGPDGFLGEPAEELGRVAGLSHRVGPGLAVLERDEAREAVEPRGHQFPRLAQHLGPLAGLARGPVLHRRRGRVERRVGVGDVGGGDGGDDTFRRGVQDGEALAPRALAPGAADPEVGVEGVEVDVDLRHGMSFLLRAGGGAVLRAAPRSRRRARGRRRGESSLGPDERDGERLSASAERHHRRGTGARVERGDPAVAEVAQHERGQRGVGDGLGAAKSEVGVEVAAIGPLPHHRDADRAVRSRWPRAGWRLRSRRGARQGRQCRRFRRPMRRRG